MQHLMVASIPKPQTFTIDPRAIARPSNPEGGKQQQSTRYGAKATSTNTLGKFFNNLSTNLRCKSIELPMNASTSFRHYTGVAIPMNKNVV